jgi:hypothetical protein
MSGGAAKEKKKFGDTCTREIWQSLGHMVID